MITDLPLTFIAFIVCLIDAAFANPYSGSSVWYVSPIHDLSLFVSTAIQNCVCKPFDPSVVKFWIMSLCIHSVANNCARAVTGTRRGSSFQAQATSDCVFKTLVAVLRAFLMNSKSSFLLQTVTEPSYTVTGLEYSHSLYWNFSPSHWSISEIGLLQRKLATNPSIKQSPRLTKSMLQSIFTSDKHFRQFRRGFKSHGMLAPVLMHSSTQVLAHVLGFKQALSL